MKKNEESKKVDFDLSLLSLNELIDLFENINGFINFLASKKVSEEAKGDKK